MSGAPEVLSILREVGASLAPDRHACVCHRVVDALCPSRPSPRTGLQPVVGPLHRQAVARLIDHTLLKAEATPADIRRLCSDARRHHFVAVCVNPVWVRLCAEELAGSDTLVATVAGFPLGASRADVKANEAAQAIGDGAREIDMVLNVGALRARELRSVEHDVRGVSDACGALGATLKVIIEAALLTDAEKVVACAVCKLAGADFVKTSTGFGAGGATAADVALMRQTVGDGLGVKAAGGIRSLATLREMVTAGASRVGTSSGTAILAELEAATGS